MRFAQLLDKFAPRADRPHSRYTFSTMAPTSWTCPSCHRVFGRRNRAHQCVPGVAIDEWFADHSPALRRIHDAVARVLHRLGPVHLEAVSVGILVKGSRTFAELRPHRDRRGHERFVLSIVLAQPPEHPRITRTMRAGAGRTAIFVDLHDARDVDADVRAWLAASYRECAPTDASATRARR